MSDKGQFAGVRGFHPGAAKFQTKEEMKRVAEDIKRKEDEFATRASVNIFSRHNSKKF